MQDIAPGDIITVPSKYSINPKTRSFAHQVVGTQALIDHPYFALFDECGAGKSKQVIDAACYLAERGDIDTVVVVCPASVRSVWCDAEIGEIKKHSWYPSRVGEWHIKKSEMWRTDQTKSDWHCLNWAITNYEFLRNGKHLEDMIAILQDYSVFLVLDESSYIKSRTAAQTKAVLKLRQHCSRVVCLNGTPIVNNPLDLFSQMKVLSSDILGENFWQFRAHYCEMVPMKFGKGPRFSKIVSYKNLDELQKKIAPYCLRRLKADCLDLPSKLYTQREVALTPESWKRYQELKKKAVIALGNDQVRLEPNAAVRIMRLAQLTSGHLGTTNDLAYRPINAIGNSLDGETNYFEREDQNLSSEKLDWCVQYLTQECTASHVIVWTRWRRERERLVKELKYSIAVGCRIGNVSEIYGGQSKTEREEAIKYFSGRATPMKELSPGVFVSGKALPPMPSDKACILVAQPHAGGFGLNLQVASEEWFLSNDWSYGVRLQAEDRAHRPGQTKSVLIGDVLATGPVGQRTIDHIILKALRDKADLAAMTTAAWRKELEHD